MTVDLERRIALTELMAAPDPPELKRGNRQRFEGRPDRYEILPVLAMLFAQIGDVDTALIWLERAVDDHTRDLIYLNVEPAFDRLRPDPRFQQLVRRTFR